LAPRPVVPAAVALVATVLTITGFMLARSGVDPSIARVNRTLGVFTAWTLGGVGVLFVRNRLAVRREEWLQAGQV
ncbi:hypothetical protein, partial [Escherichia coli]